MPWATDFIDYLEERGPFKPVFKVFKHTFTEWGQPASDYIASTHPNFNTDSVQTIIDGSLQHSGYRLNTQTFVVSSAGWSFMVGSNPCAHLTRGHVLRLYWGFDVFDPADMEILDWGVVRDITAHGGVKLSQSSHSQGPWTITCDPFFSMLQQRPTTEPSEVALFNTIDDESDIDSDYTASDSTLVVLSTSGFDTHTDADIGGMLVHGNDNDFYASFLGTTGGTDFDNFTVIPGQGFPDNDADAPNEAEERAYLFGHPSEIYRQLLASTGTGGNGTYDILPKQWSYGLDEQYIDDTDCDAYMDASLDTLRLYIFAEEQDNALQWMLNWLAPGGWFPCIYQGAFTLRCVLHPDTEDPNDGVEITDDDLEDGPDAVLFNAFSPDSPLTYRVIRVASAQTNHTSGAFASETPSLPARLFWDIDYSNPGVAALYDPTLADEQGAAISIYTRLRPWFSVLPQLYTLKCVGPRHFARAVGSRVLLTTGQDSSGSYARLTERDDSKPREKSALVVGWFPDLNACKIKLELAVMPEFTTEIP